MTTADPTNAGFSAEPMRTSARPLPPRLSLLPMAEEPLPTPDELRRWYRWGWIPLIAGCVVLVALALPVSEVLLDQAGFAVRDSRLRLLLLLRAALTSVLLAAWVGFYLLRSRRRINALRADLRAQRLELEERQRAALEVAALGGLARLVAHEIRTPLNSLMLQHALVARAVRKLPAGAPPEVEQALQGVAADAARINALVGEYLAAAERPEDPFATTAVRMRELLERAVAHARPEFARRDVTLEVAPRPEQRERAALSDAVQGDRLALEQLLAALLRGGLGLAPRGGVVRLQVGRAREQRDFVRVCLEVPAARFDRPDQVFRPFYKHADGESGLWATTVRDLVRAHGGEVRAENIDEGAGARICVRLPVAE